MRSKQGSESGRRRPQFEQIYNLQRRRLMIEDEQILLQNLSSDLLPIPPPCPSSPANQSQSPEFDKSAEIGFQLVTEKASPRKFYVDWSQAHNHHYFTGNCEEEEAEEAEREEAIVKPQPRLEQSAAKADYWGIASKLELALALIQGGVHAHQPNPHEKRSQSNEPHREREVKGLTKTSIGFKPRKQSMHYRFKTETEEDPPDPARKQKYCLEGAIEEEGSREGCRENALRRKFLASIAEWQQRKERRIQERMERELRVVMEGVTFTPEINPRSREIMKKKGAITPIYEREHRDKKRELTERNHPEQKLHRVKF